MANPDPIRTLPSALGAMNDIGAWIAGRRLALFLDYDGTLAPIVARPQEAALAKDMYAVLRALRPLAEIAIVSGRSRTDVERRVAIEGIVYAGSHGFDIAGPPSSGIRREEGAPFKPMIAAAAARLRGALAGIAGALVEDKAYTVAVHYRLVDSRQRAEIEEIVAQVLFAFPGLGLIAGKKVYELRPDLDWDKGRAVAWLIDAWAAKRRPLAPIYIGDDVTDEDAFKALKGRGIGIVVADAPIETSADYRLKDPGEVRLFLAGLGAIVGSGEDDGK